jgi:hypothetical protein
MAASLHSTAPVCFRTLDQDNTCELWKLAERTVYPIYLACYSAVPRIPTLDRFRYLRAALCARLNNDYIAPKNGRVKLQTKRSTLDVFYSLLVAFLEAPAQDPTDEYELPQGSCFLFLFFLFMC